MEMRGAVAETFRIASADAHALVALEGAEPLAWRACGRDLLWTPDPAVWDRASPILFPIVGRARAGTVRVDGRAHPMGIHGFAAASRFEPVEVASDRIRLRLVDDEATRERYPFAFRLDVSYRVMGDALSAAFEVENTGSDAMPYALGFHPGFAWPFAGGPREGHRIDFAEPEQPEVPVITKDGLFAADRRPVPLEGCMLALDDAVMAREALCFLDANSRALRFVAPDGSAIKLEAEDFPHWALWSRPPARFLCIESWTGHGDPDGFEGDLFEKPSMRVLAPGAVARHAVHMRFVPGPASD